MHNTVSREIRLNCVKHSNHDLEDAVSQLVLCIAAKTTVNKVVAGHIKGMLKENQTYVSFNCTKVDVVNKKSSHHYKNYRFKQPVLYLGVILFGNTEEGIEKCVDECIKTKLTPFL